MGEIRNYYVGVPGIWTRSLRVRQMHLTHAKPISRVLQRSVEVENLPQRHVVKKDLHRHFIQVALFQMPSRLR